MAQRATIENYVEAVRVVKGMDVTSEKWSGTELGIEACNALKREERGQ